MKLSLYLLISFITISLSFAQTKIYLIDDRNDLYLFNPQSCTKTLIGNTGTLIFDIAYNPKDRFLYGISMFGGLVKINPIDAQVVGNYSWIYGGNSLTCDKNGIFYGCNGNAFFTYDLINNQYTYLNSSPWPLIPAGDMTFLNGEILLSATNFILSQDPFDFKYTIISNDNILSNAYGMCSVNEGCNSELYIFSGIELYKMDPITFQSELVCPNMGISVLGAASTSESVDSKKTNLFSNITKCSYDTSFIELKSRVIGASYLWQDGSTKSSFLTNKAGKYWVTSQIDSCINSDTIEIMDNYYEKVNLGEDRKICTWESVNLDLNIYNALYVWSDNGFISTDPKKTINNPGKYWVNQTIGNCTSSDTILIEQLALPDLINVSGDRYGCEHDTLMIQLPIVDSCKYVWLDGSTKSSLKVYETGQYMVFVENDHCSTAKVINVLMNPVPKFNLGNDTSICANNTLIIGYDSSGTYKWNNGSLTPTYTVTKPGLYWLTVTSANNCSFTDSIEVTNKDCEVILTMPNIFTPNNDGLNEHFIPLEIKNIILAELKIFNRWGALIFSTFDLEKGWDGEGASDAVYYWSIDYVDKNNKKDTLKSYLTLAR